MSRTRKITGWILSILAIIPPSWGVIGKLTNEGMQGYMASVGYEDWTTIIAMGELTSIILFILPKTGKLGILPFSALMGGAIATHMANNEPFIMQSTVILMAWAAILIRYPEILRSGTYVSTPEPK